MSLWSFTNETRSTTFFPSVDSMTVNNQQPCSLATLTALLQDPTGAYFFSRDEIKVRFNGTVIFAGIVSRYLENAASVTGQLSQYTLTARDYTALLSRSVITRNRGVTESLAARLTWIMSWASADFGITLGSTTGLTDSMDPLNTKGMSVMDALSATADDVGASFYVDFTKVLRFFKTLPSLPAPFDIVSTADGSWMTSDVAFSGFQLDRDLEPLATAIFVNGTGVSTWVTDSGAIATWGRLEFALNDPSITTLTRATRRGTRLLNEMKQPNLAGQFTLRTPGLLPLQTFHAKVPRWSVDSDYLVSGTTIRYLNVNTMVMDVTFSDRFTPCHMKSGTAGSLAQIISSGTIDPVPGGGGGTGGGTGTSCADCSRLVALLPSGMDSDLSLARGSNSMHAFDGTQLARYDCSLAQIDYNASVSGALLAMYASPTYETVLLGDKAVYANTSLGAYGDARWSITDRTVLAAAVMDIDRAWLVTDSPDSLAVLDDFNRSTAGGTLGTASGDGAWTVIGAGAAAFSADGSHLVYGSFSVGFNSTTGYLSGLSAIDQDFTVLVGPFYMNAAFIADSAPIFQLKLGTLSPNPSAYFEKDGSVWNLYVEGPSNINHIAIPAPTASTTYYLKWQHQYGATSRAKMWATADPEPDWLVSRNDAGDGSLDTPGQFNVHANSTNISQEIHVDEIRLGSAFALETRGLTDGSLVGSANLDQSTAQIRRSPDGQHVYVLQGESTLLKYDRYLTLEDTITLADNPGGDAGFASVELDWNVDSTGVFWRLWDDATAGTMMFFLNEPDGSYDSVGVVNDLSSHSYQFPSLQTIPGGTGQQLVALSGGRMMIVGYKGGADWLAGSTGLLLSASAASSSVTSLEFGDPAGIAQIEAFGVASTGCWWMLGATKDETFLGQVASGVRGWVMKTEPT